MCRATLLRGLVAPGRRLRWALAAAALLGFCLGPGLTTGAVAGTFEAGGLVFSDELGGFRLLSAGGRGTASDPIILIEEITSLTPAVLVVRQVVSETTRSPSDGFLLRSLIKVVVNKSAWRWSGFDLELRGENGRASVYSDGLSFDQLSAMATPLYSDLFGAIRAEDEPFDRLRYDQGRVEPDQTVQLAFNLMDLNPRSLFYLAQEPIVLLTEGPERPGRLGPLYAGLVKRPDAGSHLLFSLPISP